MYTSWFWYVGSRSSITTSVQLPYCQKRKWKMPAYWFSCARANSIVLQNLSTHYHSLSQSTDRSSSYCTVHRIECTHVNANVHLAVLLVARDHALEQLLHHRQRRHRRQQPAVTCTHRAHEHYVLVFTVQCSVLGVDCRDSFAGQLRQ